jgi:hypothetical protein
LTYVNFRAYNDDKGANYGVVPRENREGHPVALLADPDRLQAYHDALRNCEDALNKGVSTNYVQFRLNELAYRFVRRDLDGISPDDIKRRMCEYVFYEGGEIDEQPETRPNWCEEFPFHHDLRLNIQDRRVYIETRLHCRIPFVPDDPWIEVVNIHDP